MMIPAPIFMVLHLLLYTTLAYSQDTSFKFNGFGTQGGLVFDGIADYTVNGLLKLSSSDSRFRRSSAFFDNPIRIKKNSSALSLSTTFVIGIVLENSKLTGHGMAFAVAPTRGLPGALSAQNIGLFNRTSNGDPRNHIFAVEFDTFRNQEFGDIDHNHVGIDINSLVSKLQHSAGYYPDDLNGKFRNMTLISGRPIQVWVEYGGVEKQINVTIAPLNVRKPNKPLLSLDYDLSSILNEDMYVGFTSSTGELRSSNYVMGWSFSVNGKASELDLSQLPKLPGDGSSGGDSSKFLTIGLPLILIFLILVVISGIVYYVRRKRRFAEVREDWEIEYGSHRFMYKDLYVATKGFSEKELLGSGGFGRVYKGVLLPSKTEIAVKKVSHESKQGMREFVAEIASMGRLRHRNIVPLLGYCRRKGELLLVYEYMPNGSLNKYLFDKPEYPLSWSMRFRVIKGVATGLKYLHQEWEQVVIHRDVKASNVLLDGDFYGRLGDFGLARQCDHGADPKTTHVGGTFGYLAPEHVRTGKATTSTDVYSFGAFLLEVACGRRPIEIRAGPEDANLVDFVLACWDRGKILNAIDTNLGCNYVVEEAELVLKLGLLCSNSEPLARPNMQQIVQYLEGFVPLPELGKSTTGLGVPFPVEKAPCHETIVLDSLLLEGR